MRSRNGSAPRPSAEAVNSALVLLAVLALNPVLLFLLHPSLFLAAVAPLVALVITQLVWRQFRWGLVTVYWVNLLCLSGVFIAAETVIRVRFHDYVMEDLYSLHRRYYFNKPNLRTQLRDKEYLVDYITNGDGYRIGRTQSPEVSVSKVDWLFIGDSYTQGAQVEFEDLYTSHLYRAFPDRVVLNAGVSGWGIYDAISFLRERGRFLEPQLIVLQVANFNDFMKVERRVAGFSDYLMQYSQLVRLILQNAKHVNPTNLPLGRWVEPFYATDSENRRFNIFYNESSPEKDKDIMMFGRALRELKSLADSLGAELLILQIPTKEQISFVYLEEVVEGLKIDPRRLDLDRPNVLLQALSDSLSIPLLDLREPFSSSAEFPFYHYDEHLNTAGHILLSDVLRSHLSIRFGLSRSRILSRTYVGDRYPRFTPNGDSILFQSPRDGSFELLLADTLKWTESRLTIDDADETHPVLLGRNQGLVFVVGDAERGATRLWWSKRDGRNAKVLSSDSSWWASIPAATPDGESLIFPSWGPSPSDTNTRLSLMALRSGVRTFLPQASAVVWRPAIDPTGRYVAYIGKVDGQYDIFELDLSTSITRRLTESPFDEWDPAYSADGRFLFYSARADGNWDLFSITRADGYVRRLTRTLGDEWDPEISPDGRRLAYAGEYGIFRGIYFLDFEN